MNEQLRTAARSLAMRLLAIGVVLAVGCSPDSKSQGYKPDPDAPAVTINIDVSESGYEPANISVPAGPNIQLILRNRTADEYHYRVVGLNATQILWLAPKDDMPREDGVSEEDHEAHHAKDFVDWRGKSPQGVRPSLTEVHAYASGRQVDVVHFYALTPGTYEVSDPLHPTIKGSLTVVRP